MGMPHRFAAESPCGKATFGGEMAGGRGRDVAKGICTTPTLRHTHTHIHRYRHTVADTRTHGHTGAQIHRHTAHKATQTH
eukprot:15309088-Alexandrium_andersonii.AAC.1